MQREITGSAAVFGRDGSARGGWSKDPLDFNYEAYPRLQKIDHRRCFFTENEQCSLYASVEKLGGELIVKVILRDKEIHGVACDCCVKKFLLNRRDMPSIIAGRFYFEDKRLKIAVSPVENGIHLQCRFGAFAGVDPLELDLTFFAGGSHSLNLALPFEKNGFYHKSFAPDTLASGSIRLGGRRYELNGAPAYRDGSDFALPYRQVYRCITANGRLNGNSFALYLGSKLGDNNTGEENCYFYKGILHKLSKIKFLGSDERIDRVWEFRAGINAVDLLFTPEAYLESPVFTKCDKTTVVYGSLSGEFNLIDCERVAIPSAPAQMIYTVI